MSNLPYTITVGLEVHVELHTKTKMFCRCLNDPFNAETPNTHVCPVCLGLPGALPVPNKEAVRKTVLVGLALGSEISRLSKWDRKHYFYPDLPKGYQISQYDLPFCVGGQVELLGDDGKVASVVRFERAHLEEDAGKLQHGGKPGYSVVDLNRAGVPLLEMVSKPDITSAVQARQFLQEMQQLVRTLGVSDADMEKGQMRCDVNISIQFPELTAAGLPHTPITEVKNVNSSRAVERSITTEAQRQYDEWMAGGPIKQRTGKITVGWDENTETVNLQRAKEGTADYRYMPEPDLPPVKVYEDPELNPDTLKLTLPELPNQRKLRYMAAGISMKDAVTVMLDSGRMHTLDAVLQLDAAKAKASANWLINADGASSFAPEQLIELVGLAESGEVSFSAVKPKIQGLLELITKGSSVKDAVAAQGLLQVHDEAVVQSAVSQVLTTHAEVVADYRAGNVKVFGFLVGQAMKAAAGAAQPAKLQEALREALK
ncbi:Asp-tRNA(Asn)/Glu-tRNA(Gln) amidotransferase subunit GatB [soil metagenome]